MGEKVRSCDSCRFQEMYFINGGEKICQHRQSVLGLEVIKEFINCEEITDCEYHEESNVLCSDCKSGYNNCQMDRMDGKCPKLNNIKDIRLTE